MQNCTMHAAVSTRAARFANGFTDAARNREMAQPGIFPLTRPASGWNAISGSRAEPVPRVLFKLGEGHRLGKAEMALALCSAM